MASLPIRLIATDVDGTLLDSRGKIPPENLRAIRAAQEKGIIFAIASGRFPENVYVLLQDVGLSCPIIGTNGANNMDEHRHVLSQHFLPSYIALQVMELLNRHGADYFIFNPALICTSSTARLHHSELSYKEKLDPLGVLYTHGLEAALECCRGPVQKFFVCNNVPLAGLREELKTIPGILLTQSSPSNIEVMPEGIDKGQGVRDMAEAYGIPLSQVMTLGDEENDIPMLRIAGYGTAMGNASAKAKAAARYITDTNDNFGLAKAIKKYAL